MSNVLSEEEKQKILALGRMAWSVRRIARETGIYRDTAAPYLREAEITVRKPGRHQLRREKTAPVVAKIHERLLTVNGTVLPKSKLGEAVDYGVGAVAADD